MAKIKVDVSSLRNVAGKITSASGSISMPSVSMDNVSTISGNSKAHEAIKSITDSVNKIKEASETFASQLKSYASSIEKTDQEVASNFEGDSID